MRASLLYRVPIFSEMGAWRVPRLVDFELACRREAEERLRAGGLSALWESAEVPSERCRRARELLGGQEQPAGARFDPSSRAP